MALVVASEVHPFLQRDSPLFSVVIPAYNSEASIREALDSIAAQTYPGYEVLVVDDGSQDATVSRVNAWVAHHATIRVQVIRRSHGGIGAARNAGVQAAQGAYIAFLDADDVWLTQKLETVVRELHRAPSLELLCHDEWLEETGRQPRRLRHGPYITYQDLLFKGNTLSTSAVVVRRDSMLDVGGFSTDLALNGVEDYDLWLRLARLGCRIGYLHEVLGVYRVHAQSVTGRIQEHCEHGLNVLAAHFRDWQQRHAVDRYRMRRRRADAFRGAGRALMKRGEHHTARQFLRLAFDQDPLSWKTHVLRILNLAHVRFV